MIWGNLEQNGGAFWMFILSERFLL